MTSQAWMAVAAVISAITGAAVALAGVWTRELGRKREARRADAETPW